MTKTLPVGAYVASALAAANIECDSGEDVDRFLAELEKRGLQISRPYVGGHPEIPLHEYRPNGRGGCLSCDEERKRWVQAALVPPESRKSGVDDRATLDEDRSHEEAAEPDAVSPDRPGGVHGPAGVHLRNVRAAAEADAERLVPSPGHSAGDAPPTLTEGWSAVEWTAGRVLIELNAQVKEHGLTRDEQEDALALAAAYWVRKHPLSAPKATRALHLAALDRADVVDERLHAIAERHHRIEKPWMPHPRCAACQPDEPWPCDVSLLLTEVRRLREIDEAARALVATWYSDGCSTCGGTGVAWDWPEAVRLRDVAALNPSTETGE